VDTPSSYGHPKGDPHRLYPQLDWDRDLYVLGIESTAHTFGVGIVSTHKPYILASARSTYVPSSGGIHPREAAAHHLKVAPEVIKTALHAAGISIREVDAFAVALGPGLGPALRVGATVARGLAAYYGKPLVPVNHAVAHVEIGRFFEGFQDPLVLFVSGGNTMVVAFAKERYRVFGETLDVALGNLLDTFAREVGLAPPFVVKGKHVVELCAENAAKPFLLPYTVKGMDVSFSGLLTAALRAWKKLPRSERPNVCLGLREVAYSAVVEVAERALAHTRKREAILTGGVASSADLRRRFTYMASYHNAVAGFPPRQLSGDNGAMIAWVGLLNLLSGITVSIEGSAVRQRWRLDEVEVPWRI
jgi:N6-L-threonylcarbamoyladenine synthase